MNISNARTTEFAIKEWLDRCLVRLMQVDPQMPRGEARDLALELFHFQRTAAMEPEAAVDFAAAEMAQDHPRLDRRSAPRD